MRNAIWLTCTLAVAVLTGFITELGQANSAELTIPFPSRVQTTPPIETLSDRAGPAERAALRSDPAASFAGQNQNPPNSRAPKAKPADDITIIPKIEIDRSSKHFWADGASPVTVWVSLKELKANQTWSYTAHEELVFQLELEPRSALVSPLQVKIPSGAQVSSPASITAKRPIKLAVTCTPARKYAGLAIKNPQAEIVEFINPIDAIGIEPSESASNQVNVAIPFKIFLYNKKDPAKTPLPPKSPVSIEVISETGNGRITQQPVELTEDQISKFINYVGTKTGAETIVANASYEGEQIKGVTNPKIVFPLWVFLSGFAGSLLGSGVRYYKATASERSGATFLESMFYGLVVCILLILYPVGTKLPEISNYIQPLLLFVLGALVSVYGPQSVHWALSFIPKGAGQE